MWSETWAGSVLDGEQVYRPDSDLRQILYSIQQWAMGRLSVGGLAGVPPQLIPETDIIQ